MRGAGAAAVLAACMTAVLPAGQVQAADAPGPARAGQMEFNIPAQPLAGALTMFGDQAGLQVTVDTAVLAGRAAPALSGRMSAEDALRRLLTGTGIVWRFADSGTVVLEKAAANGAMTLDPVTVEGQGRSGAATETAWTPVKTYVARRTVTGTKTDTPIVETAQSISVVTRRQMDDQAAQNLNDALRYTSGVIPESRGAVATRYDMMKIRGFDTFNYIDGLRMQKLNYVGPQLDTFLLERAEVLKGPSSVLYGQAPAGGMVNQVVKAPTEQSFNEAGFEFGTDNHWVGTYDMSGAVTADRSVLFRIAAVGRTEDGQIRDAKSDRVAVLPSLSLHGTSGTSLVLNAVFQRDPHGNTYGGVPTVGSVLPNRNGTIASDVNLGEPDAETFYRTQVGVGYRFEQPLTDVATLRLNGRRLSSEVDYSGVYASSLAADQRTLTRAVTQSHDELDSWTFDNQLEHKVATGPVAHTVLGGLDYQTWSGFYATGTGSGTTYVANIDIFNPVYAGGIRQAPVRTRTDAEGTQTGLYLQDQAELGGWRLTLAGRMDWAKSRTAARGAVATQSDNAFTGRAALLYLFDNGVAPYAGYAESFTPQSGTDSSGNPFKPEMGRQYEIGGKYQPPGSDSLITAALFQLVRENLLTKQSTDAYYTQVGEARARGLELEAKVVPLDGWTVIAAYTYTDAIYTKDRSGLQRAQMPGVPRHMTALWNHYDFTSGAPAGLGLGIGVRHRTESYNPNNSATAPEYTLVDAALSYDLGKAADTLDGARFYVNVKNLFDTTHIASCYTNTGCGYGYGRTVVAGLKMRW